MITIFRALVASGAIVIGTAGVAGAQYGTPQDAPLRITVELQPSSDAKPAERLARNIVSGVKSGVRKGLPKHAVQIVEPGEPADVVVKVQYRAVSIPARQVVLTNGKPGVIPAEVAESLAAVLAGRELVAKHSPMYPWNHAWTFTAESLGRDVAVVLKAGMGGPAAEANDPLQLDQWIQQLKTKDQIQRALAVQQIAHLGPAGRAATGALVQVLDDDRPLRVVGPGTRTSVGEQAAKALVRIGATQALVDFFRSDEDDDARSEALLALTGSSHPDVADLVMGGLDDRARRVRTTAAYMAGRAVGTRAIPRLIEIVGQRKYVEMRDGARFSLVKLSGQDFGLDGDKWRAWWAATNTATRR